MNVKALIWVSVIMAIGVAIYEGTWLSRTSLAVVIIAVLVAVILQGVYLLIKKE